MTEPRTFRHSETNGYCAPPRVHLDRYTDDVDGHLRRQFADAIWDATVENEFSSDGKGDWVWEHNNTKRFYELLDERRDYDLKLNQKSPVSDDSIDVNAKGGRQSRLETRFDLAPFSAMYEAAKILKTGAEKYGVDNWRKIPTEDHVNHALEHLYRHIETARLGLSDEGGDYDLGHALVRLMFAVAIDNDGEIS